MAKLLKLRRGTTTQHGSFTGAEGEVTVDTDKETLVVHDGSTAGGHPVAAEDMANVSSASIAGRLATDSIAVGKIAAGTLPSDVKVTDSNVSGNLTIESADIVDGTIVNADVNASAAIAGTKIAPVFGSQNISTTGSLSCVGANIDNQIIINGQTAQISLVDSDANPDYLVKVNGGIFDIRDNTADATRLSVQSDGHVDVAGNLDVGAGLDVTGNITVTGTVDGRDIASLGNKIDGIENNATADQTAAEIRTLVESASDSNVFTDADHSKLNGIESGATADQTGAEIAPLLDGQNLYTTQKIGRNSGDYIQWSPNAHIDVYINSSNEFRFEADGDFHADGDVYAFSTTVSSDENLKKDITIVSDAVTKVEALKGVTFKWKKNDADSAGVIAQDVEKVLPEVVKTVNDMEGNEFKAVNYAGLTSILIEAVKDLSARIKVLEAK